MNDAELAVYWKFQAMHFKRLAVAYQQELLALKNTPTRERSHGRGLHPDPTATRAVHNVSRQQKGK
ncbi:hypothetical protein J2790_004263 [Paenarthrobacter nicotinovorans]|uniref:hypothetical protein n=1 Tax=Micrococcaceae TaxID=1268 RepID=UPI00087730D7|nr:MULTISPECIES: hypothetical protein [Micrococcaceae]MDR6439088.1 hypothetical protein [Paenarthrobacter nicotinovorans]SCZ65325.1 hypothetical protein SAMN02799638_04152 [Arthrobacter sp. UNCCL28]